MSVSHRRATRSASPLLTDAVWVGLHVRGIVWCGLLAVFVPKSHGAAVSGSGMLAWELLSWRYRAGGARAGIRLYSFQGYKLR